MNFARRGVLPRSTSTISNTSGASTDNESTYGNEVEDEEKDKFKRKTRNLSEKKRRDQFNLLINELCSMVSTTTRKMDKSTVLKSTIAFLKNYQELAMQSQAHEIKEDWKPSFLSNDEFTQLMLEALDSFLLVFTQQGNILYASESITSLLGHLPKDLINRSLYDFVHDTERNSLHNLLFSYTSIPTNSIPDSDNDDKNQVSFMCHLKRGSTMPAVPDVFEYVKVTGSLRKWSKTEDGARTFFKDVSHNENDSACFCCTVQLQPCQLIREMSNIDDSKTEFTSRHSFEWKFLFLDHRAPPIIGYLPFEVLGTSGYDYYHPDDLEKLSACHIQLMQAGEGTSCFYRFLTKGQQWIWLKTRYYITYHQWNSKPEFIVCTHKVFSYSDVRMHLRKELGFDEEDVEVSRSVNATPEKSSTRQTSPAWAIELTSVIGGSPPAPNLRILSDQADIAEKPHSTLEEQTMLATKPKQKTNVAQLTVQQTLPLPQLQPKLQPRRHQNLAEYLQQQHQQKLQVQQQNLQAQHPPPPAPQPPPSTPTQASPSTTFQQSPSTTKQQQKQEVKQQSPPSALILPQPTPPPQPPAPQQPSQQQPTQQPSQQQQHQSLLLQQQLTPSTSQSPLPPIDLSSHPSLTVPGMMVMMAPPTIPTTDLETVQVSPDLQISTVLNPGQTTLAVSELSLPQGVAQTSTALLPQLFMTPAQRQLHKQLQFKSQQLQQTILRQQEELRQITEELSLAHQFMPISDSANTGAQMLMMNPATFTTPTTEIPSTSSTAQFNLLPQPITIQQPVPQQFLPFQILPTSHGQILCQSPSSSTSNNSTHKQQQQQ